MNRKEYVKRLEQLLQDLSKEEREEALQYYNDYLEDAGWENEDTIIRELGTPEEVAEKIRAGCSGEYAQYSEQGFGDARFQNIREIVPGQTEQKESPSGKTKEKHKGNVWKIFAILLLVFFALPVILPVGIAVIAVVISLAVAVMVLLFGFGISGLVIFAAGIAVIVTGIAKAVWNPATGILAAGIGCIMLAIGILLSLGIFKLFLKIVPQVIRWTVNLLKTPFRKAGNR